MRAVRGVDVFLVGRRIQDNENLGLGYLRAALRDAGFTTTVCYANFAGDVSRVAQESLAANPRVLGLSLADGGSAFVPLALGELLGRRGFRGHITCGGQFATLARHWLLERYAWLASVVRYAGERPLVELVRHLRARRPLTTSPG
jgi:hypothetical protein